MKLSKPEVCTKNLKEPREIMRKGNTVIGTIDILTTIASIK
jgi:hypothetical protein